MTFSRVALVTTAAAFILLQACSSSSDDSNSPSAEQAKVDAAFNTPTPPTFVDHSVNVDQHFADSTDATSATQLTVTTAGNEALIGKVAVGTILAGNRNSQNIDPASSTNAYGFLRRVTAITVVNGNTVYTTVPAELDEWIKDGDLDFNDPNSIFTTTTSAIGGKSLHILDDQAAGGSGSASAKGDHEFDGDEKTTDKGYKIKPHIKLSNTKLNVNAQYSGYFKVRTIIGLPRHASFKSLLTVDPVFTTDLEVGIAVDGGGAGLNVGTVNGITIAGLTADLLPPVIIPIASPVPLTVRFHPRLKCTLGASGEATAQFNATLRSHAAVGFQGEASPTSITTTDLSTAPTFTPTYAFKGGQIKANVEAECALLAVPEVLAFDAVGLSGEIGPYIDFDFNTCLNANVSAQETDVKFTISEQHGLALNFAARAQLPVVGIGKDFPLLNVHTAKSTEFFIVGDKKTCELETKDSCNGRTDGFYCSVVNTYAGLNCKGGQVLNGLQCEGGTSKKCVSGTTTSINCQ